MAKFPESVKSLSQHEFQKWLKWGKRGYEHCSETLERLYDYDNAVYSEELDMMFKNTRALSNYSSRR